MKLTAKQQRFVEAYTGNATQAARDAGYAGDDATLGQVGYENLKKPEIAAALAAREAPASAYRLASKGARQEFLAKVAEDDSQEMRDRLRALELLGKSCADFVDRLEVEGKLTLEQLVLGAVGKAK